MNRLRAAVLVLPVLFLAQSAPALAQDQGDVGINMGYPASAGVVFHLTDSVALRPEISFTRISSDSDSAFGDLSTSNYTYEIGISGLLYVGRWDKLRAYVAPGYAYRRTGGANEVDFPQIGSTTVSGHTFQGSFGAQYSLHEKFSVFGEAGLRYFTQQTRSSFSNAGVDFRSIGSRGAVGVIFYF
jgi:Outer membrane protein beta-barrel domain